MTKPGSEVSGETGAASIGCSVDAYGVPMTGRVAGPRGRVFPFGYGTAGEGKAPVCGLHGAHGVDDADGVEMQLDNKADVWTCPTCHPAEVRGALQEAPGVVVPSDVSSPAAAGDGAVGDGPAGDPEAAPVVGGVAAEDP